VREVGRRQASALAVEAIDEDLVEAEVGNEEPPLREVQVDAVGV
jgi:hypothetical protein